MFSRKENTNSCNYSKIDTLIGIDSVIEGKMTTNGTIRIDGTINGDLTVKGTVIISETGKVFGNLDCENSEISGILKGNVDCVEQLRITDSGKLYGDINVQSFVVDENGLFDGNCKMHKSSSSSNVEDVVSTNQD